MNIVHIGVDQANRHGLDLFLAQPLQVRAQLCLVERADNRTVCPDPFGRFDGRFQRGHRFGFRPDDPRREPTGDQTARDLENIAVPLGHDQPDAGNLMFEHRIGRHRRAVQEQRQILRRDACFRA